MILSASPPRVYEIAMPEPQTIPVVLASPHSGRDYPAAFLASTKLQENQLAASEDRYVDELVAAAPALGAPLIRALFPRSFVDLNREAYEMDPGMFDEPLPDFVNSRSPRVAAGLGVIPRVIAGGVNIYDRPMRFSDALIRISGYYQPYHAALRELVDATRDRFGVCLLVDCHSMPSDSPSGRDRPPAFVLGDCHAAACGPEIIAEAERALVEQGFRVARNRPYAGGFTTRHYGRPKDGVHALQVEINRALYMDERRYSRLPGFDGLAAALARLIAALGKRLSERGPIR
jgi:N-formylglutamate amidohydrolase